MSWLSSIVVALLTGAAGLVLSGFVASLAARWYQVSGFEGGSAYFMAAFALLGAAVGLVLGLIVARALGGPGVAGFLKATGISLASLVGLIAIVGGTARALADVPPTIGGEPLTLLVEARWPADHDASPADEPGEAFVRLGALSGRTQRVSVRGPLWKEDARREDGRWIVPGAVSVFTGRGKRVLVIELAATGNPGFALPLPSRPGRKDMQWSEWMPRIRPGAAPLPHGITYRYRVVRESEPVRVERFGPFEIATMVHDFFETQVNGRSTVDAMAHFAIRYRGQPLSFDGFAIGDQPAERTERVSGVASLPGPRPALVANVGGRCFLVVDEGARARVDSIGDCQSLREMAELTSDNARFHAAAAQGEYRGRFERHLFADVAGPLLLQSASVDPRTQTVHHFDGVTYDGAIPSVRPLSVSPDGRSFVRLINADNSGDRQALVVIDAAARQTYTLPIDPVRMRFANLHTFDPAWVAHHFAWVRGADGVDRLTQRPDFVPLPYHGRIEPSSDGGMYWLEPAREGLRDAVVAFLVTEMHGTRVPEASDSYKQRLRVDGHIVDVGFSDSSHYVAVTNAYDSTGNATVLEIARRFDAVLATGVHDALFGK